MYLEDVIALSSYRADPKQCAGSVKKLPTNVKVFGLVAEEADPQPFFLDR
jgi:hypothetical protein